jgi:hypothetical protein
MKAYEASGRSEPGAIWVVGGAAIVVGVVTGALFHWVGTYFKLFILWEMAMGGIVGAIAATLIGKKKMRAPVLAGLLAAMGGLFAGAVDHGIPYFTLRTAIESDVQKTAADWQSQNGVAFSEADIGRTVDVTIVIWGRGQEMSGGMVLSALAQAPFTAQDPRHAEAAQMVPTSSEVFWGFVNGRAQAGMKIESTGRSDQEFGQTGTLIIWLLQTLLIVGTAFFVAFGRARAPFSEAANDWFSEAPVWKAGLGPVKDQKALKAAFLSGNWSLLMETIRDLHDSPKKPVFELAIFEAPKPGGGFPSFIRLNRMVKGSGGTIAKGLITPNEDQALRKAIEAEFAQDDRAGDP